MQTLAKKPVYVERQVLVQPWLRRIIHFFTVLIQRQGLGGGAAQYAKDKMDKSVQVDFSLDIPSSSTSTCEIPLLSSEVVGCLLNSTLLSRPCSVSGVLQPELVGAALSNSIVDSLMDNLL